MKTAEAKTFQIPFSALKSMKSKQSGAYVVIEISISDLERNNTPATMDELIQLSRVDYALGNYTSHTSANSMVEELHRT